MASLPGCHVSHVCQIMHNGENKVKPGAVHRPTGIYLTTDKNPENSARRTSEGCTASGRLKWGSLPSNDVGRLIKHVRRRKEGNVVGRDRKGIIWSAHQVIEKIYDKSLMPRLDCWLNFPDGCTSISPTFAKSDHRSLHQKQHNKINYDL